MSLPWRTGSGVMAKQQTDLVFHDLGSLWVRGHTGNVRCHRCVMCSQPYCGRTAIVGGRCDVHRRAA